MIPYFCRTLVNIGLRPVFPCHDYQPDSFDAELRVVLRGLFLVLQLFDEGGGGLSQHFIFQQFGLVGSLDPIQSHFCPFYFLIVLLGQPHSLPCCFFQHLCRGDRRFLFFRHRLCFLCQFRPELLQFLLLLVKIRPQLLVFRFKLLMVQMQLFEVLCFLLQSSVYLRSYPILSLLMLPDLLLQPFYFCFRHSLELVLLL